MATEAHYSQPATAADTTALLPKRAQQSPSLACSMVGSSSTVSSRPSPDPLRSRKKEAVLEVCVLDALDTRSIAATARAHLGSGHGAPNYGPDVHAVSRQRSRARIEKAFPNQTLQFAQAVVNETLSSSSEGGPNRAATTLVAVLAGTVDRQTRLDLGLFDPGGFEGSVSKTAARTNQEVASILDAVGPTNPSDPSDVGFKARVADEMHEWRVVLAERIHRHAKGGKRVAASDVAAAGLAFACAWVAATRGHPSAAGAAATQWSKCGEVSACLVASGAFGALEEPTAQLRAAWAAHGLADGYARATFREVSQVVAAALAPVFARGVVLCGSREVLHMAARSAALVVATSEYLTLRIEPMLVMFSEPMESPKRKSAGDTHATLPAIDGTFPLNAVLNMCSDLSSHPTRADICEYAQNARLALESSVQHYLPHASAQRGGVPFERLALADLCAAVLSNPRPPRQDHRLAKWHALACKTVSRLRIVRPSALEEKQRIDTHWLLDERREARFVATESAHRALSRSPAAELAWSEALGASWNTLFARYANAKAATDRFAVAVKGESVHGAELRAELYNAASADANSILEGNDAATRMWAVSNVSYASMRYVTFGQPPYSLAAAPLDARIVHKGGEGVGGILREKRMATWVTAYPASLA